MVKVKIGNKEIYIDGYLKRNLDGCKNLVKKDWDMVLIIDGEERCQPKGSKVLMADGIWKNIEDVKVNDLVLSPQKDGTHLFSKVKKTTSWFSDENYNVVELNRNKRKLYSCSHNHLIPLNYKVSPRKNGKRLAKDRYWDIRHYQADYYSTLSTKRTKKDSTTLSSFPIQYFKDRKNCQIEPYTLGVLLGDGSITNRLSITTMNPEVMEEVSKFYKVIRVSKKQGTEAKDYHFSKRITNPLYGNLIKYNLYKTNSGTKFIPREALLSDIEYRKKVLAGLIDTDGYLSKKNGYSICTKSERLSNGILNLVYSLGGRGSIKKVKKGIKKLNFVGEYYNVSFYLGKMELPIKIKRKIRDDNFFYLSANRVSIDVKKSKPEMVYGFEIDSQSNWYVTDNWMITHNSGKSCLAQQAALYCDPTFCLDRVVFNPEKFEEAIDNSKPEQAIVYDEAYGGLNSKSVLSSTSQILVKRMTEIGMKRLFIFIVMPCFFDMNKYIAIWRSRALLHVYHANYNRGRFACWSGEKKKELYVLGKKFYNYRKPHAEFIGRFTDGYVVDRKAYEKKKAKDTMNTKDEDTTSRRGTKIFQQRDAAFNLLRKNFKNNYKEIAQELNFLLPDNNKIDHNIVRKGGVKFGRVTGLQ